MIPLRLELTNFLSYRETAVLDFTGIHLACISGANGAGKSSILDSITWALFGKARSKSDDDLVNRRAALAGDTAAVTYIFALEESTYRVIRRKRVRQATKLELQILANGNYANGKWKTLSESKVRETEAAIVNLLNMNYDTFINASFLIQGKADEFTTKTPGKRKEILADLLGVSQWDQYRDAAAEKRKAAETAIMLLDSQMGDIAAELEEEEARKEALATAQETHQAIANRLKDKEKLLAELKRVETAVQQQQANLKNLETNLSHAQTSLANLQKSQSQRQHERDSYQATLDDAEAIIAAFAAYEQADAQLRQWQAKADQFNKLQRKQHKHELAITQERSRLTTRQKELTAQQEKSKQAQAERKTVIQTITDDQAQLTQTTAKLSALTQQIEAWHEARTELQRLQSERQSYHKEQSRLQSEAAKIEKLAQEKTAVTTNHSAAHKKITQLTADLAASETQNVRYATAKAELDTINGEQPRLREQMDKLAERINRLQVETGGSCPLCGQELSESHRHAVLEELQTDGKEAGDRFRANKQRITDLTAEVADLEQKLKQKPRLEKELQSQRDRLVRAEARLTEITQSLTAWEQDGQVQLAAVEATLAETAVLDAQTQKVNELSSAATQKETLEKAQQAQQRAIANAEARLAEIDKLLADWSERGQPELAATTAQLNANEYATEAQTAMAALNQQISELDYDADAHNTAKQAHADLAAAPKRQQALQQAKTAVDTLDATLTDLAAQLAAQKQTVKALAAQQETAVAQLADLQSSEGDLRATENEVIDLREEEIAANRTVGAAQQRLSVLDDLRQRSQSLLDERAEKTLQVQRLKLLEKACGRDGVQALLIEHALPEIEEHANELLERLTGGDMRLSFETQRKLKSRDAITETLDIRISDSAGERPYDNFSGGEQFRVNFAVRLALSQLLAKRAGARLQTLVIDEGFGSQDPNGRQRLVEAINTIQDDFVRILVITHIDELRDAFPARIEVTKSLTGSSAMVI